jgi:hypothetical protein
MQVYTAWGNEILCLFKTGLTVLIINKKNKAGRKGNQLHSLITELKRGGTKTE